MLWTWLSPTLIVAAALVLIGLERLCPYDPRQRLLRAGFWTDLLGYGLVQSYLLGLCIATVIGWLDRQTGLSRLQLVSRWPVVLQVALLPAGKPAAYGSDDPGYPRAGRWAWLRQHAYAFRAAPGPKGAEP